MIYLDEDQLCAMENEIADRVGKDCPNFRLAMRAGGIICMAVFNGELYHLALNTKDCDDFVKWMKNHERLHRPSKE